MAPGLPQAVDPEAYSTLHHEGGGQHTASNREANGPLTSGGPQPHGHLPGRTHQKKTPVAGMHGIGIADAAKSKVAAHHEGWSYDFRAL